MLSDTELRSLIYLAATLRARNVAGIYAALDGCRGTLSLLGLRPQIEGVMQGEPDWKCALDLAINLEAIIKKEFLPADDTGMGAFTMDDAQKILDQRAKAPQKSPAPANFIRLHFHTQDFTAAEFMNITKDLNFIVDLLMKHNHQELLAKWSDIRKVLDKFDLGWVFGQIGPYRHQGEWEWPLADALAEKVYEIIKRVSLTAGNANCKARGVIDVEPVGVNPKCYRIPLYTSKEEMDKARAAGVYQVMEDRSGGMGMDLYRYLTKVENGIIQSMDPKEATDACDWLNRRREVEGVMMGLGRDGKWDVAVAEAKAIREHVLQHSPQNYVARAMYDAAVAAAQGVKTELVAALEKIKELEANLQRARDHQMDEASCKSAKAFQKIRGAYTFVQLSVEDNAWGVARTREALDGSHYRVTMTEAEAREAADLLNSRGFITPGDLEDLVWAARHLDDRPEKPYSEEVLCADARHLLTLADKLSRISGLPRPVVGRAGNIGPQGQEGPRGVPEPTRATTPAEAAELAKPKDWNPGIPEALKSAQACMAPAAEAVAKHMAEEINATPGVVEGVAVGSAAGVTVEPKPVFWASVLDPVVGASGRNWGVSRGGVQGQPIPLTQEEAQAAADFLTTRGQKPAEVEVKFTKVPDVFRTEHLGQPTFPADAQGKSVEHIPGFGPATTQEIAEGITGDDIVELMEIHLLLYSSKLPTLRAKVTRVASIVRKLNHQLGMKSFVQKGMENAQHVQEAQARFDMEAAAAVSRSHEVPGQTAMMDSATGKPVPEDLLLTDAQFLGEVAGLLQLGHLPSGASMFTGVAAIAGKIRQQLRGEQRELVIADAIFLDEVAQVLREGPTPTGKTMAPSVTFIADKIRQQMEPVKPRSQAEALVKPRSHQFHMHVIDEGMGKIVSPVTPQDALTLMEAAGMMRCLGDLDEIMAKSSAVEDIAQKLMQQTRGNAPVQLVSQETLREQVRKLRRENTDLRDLLEQFRAMIRVDVKYAPPRATLISDDRDWQVRLAEISQDMEEFLKTGSKPPQGATLSQVVPGDLPPTVFGYSLEEIRDSLRRLEQLEELGRKIADSPSGGSKAHAGACICVRCEAIRDLRKLFPARREEES